MPSAIVRWTVAGIRKPPQFCGGPCVCITYFYGERWERRLRRMKRPERVAAVSKMQACFVRRSICWAPQQDRASYRHGIRKRPVDTCRHHNILKYRKRTKPKLGSLCWHYLFSRPVTRQLSSAYVCLTSVFGMGTGGPTRQSTRTIW